MADHTENAKDLALSFYRRIRQDIPSIEMTFKNEYALSIDTIPAGYDFYILHISGTNQVTVNDLRDRDRLSFIVGMSGMANSSPEVLQKMLELFTEKDNPDNRLFDLIIPRDSWDENVDKLAVVLIAEDKKRTRQI